MPKINLEAVQNLNAKLEAKQALLSQAEALVSDHVNISLNEKELTDGVKEQATAKAEKLSKEVLDLKQTIVDTLKSELTKKRPEEENLILQYVINELEKVVDIAYFSSSQTMKILTDPQPVKPLQKEKESKQRMIEELQTKCNNMRRNQRGREYEDLIIRNEDRINLLENDIKKLESILSLLEPTKSASSSSTKSSTTHFDDDNTKPLPPVPVTKTVERKRESPVVVPAVEKDDYYVWKMIRNMPVDARLEFAKKNQDRITY